MTSNKVTDKSKLDRVVREVATNLGKIADIKSFDKMFDGEILSEKIRGLVYNYGVDQYKRGLSECRKPLDNPTQDVNNIKS